MKSAPVSQEPVAKWDVTADGHWGFHPRKDILRENYRVMLPAGTYRLFTASQPTPALIAVTWQALDALEDATEAIRVFRNEGMLRDLTKLRATEGYSKMESARDRGLVKITNLRNTLENLK